MLLMTFRHGLRASEVCGLQWSDVEFESATLLENKGIDTRTLQAYLGHRSIQSTVRYTELAPGRFKNLWR